MFGSTRGLQPPLWPMCRGLLKAACAPPVMNIIDGAYEVYALSWWFNYIPPPPLPPALPPPPAPPRTPTMMRPGMESMLSPIGFHMKDLFKTYSLPPPHHRMIEAAASRPPPQRWAAVRLPHWPGLQLVRIRRSPQNDGWPLAPHPKR